MKYSSPPKNILIDTRKKDWKSAEKIKDILSTGYLYIREQFRLTDVNCEFKRVGSGVVSGVGGGVGVVSGGGVGGGVATEYLLTAWPYTMKVYLLDSHHIGIRIETDCEGVSHDGIREAMRVMVEQIRAINA